MRVVINQKKKLKKFLPLARIPQDRCSWEVAALGQSRGVTAAHAGTPKPAQNEFSGAAIKHWPCGVGAQVLCWYGTPSSAELACGVLPLGCTQGSPGQEGWPILLEKMKGKSWRGLGSVPCAPCSYLHWDVQQRFVAVLLVGLDCIREQCTWLQK